MVIDRFGKFLGYSKLDVIFRYGAMDIERSKTTCLQHAFCSCRHRLRIDFAKRIRLLANEAIEWGVCDHKQDLSKFTILL